MPPKRGNLGILAPATAAEIAGAAAGAAERKEKNKKIAGWGGLNEGILVPNNRNNNNNNGKAKKKARGANNWGGANILHGMGEEAGIGTGVEEEEGAGAGGGGGGSSNRGYGRSLSAAAERAPYNYRSSSLEPPRYPNFSEVMASLPAAAAPLNKPNKRNPVTKRKRNRNNGNNTRKGAGGAAAAPKPKANMRKPNVGAAAAGAGGGAAAGNAISAEAGMLLADIEAATIKGLKGKGTDGIDGLFSTFLARRKALSPNDAASIKRILQGMAKSYPIGIKALLLGI